MRRYGPHKIWTIASQELRTSAIIFHQVWGMSWWKISIFIIYVVFKRRDISDLWMLSQLPTTQHSQFQNVMPSKSDINDKDRHFPPTHTPNLVDCYEKTVLVLAGNCLHLAQTISSWHILLWFWNSKRKSELSISNKMWQNAFRSNPETNHIFLDFTFQLHTWLIFCFF